MKGILAFCFVLFLWLGSIHLSARHGIHWPMILLIVLGIGGAAKADQYEDDYYP